jgi:hypothetical protein
MLPICSFSDLGVPHLAVHDQTCPRQRSDSRLVTPQGRAHRNPPCGSPPMADHPWRRLTSAPRRVGWRWRFGKGSGGSTRPSTPPVGAWSRHPPAVIRPECDQGGAHGTPGTAGQSIREGTVGRYGTWGIPDVFE